MRASVVARLFVIVSCAFRGYSAAAETIVRVEGDVPSAEVCRFRAGNESDPFSRWLTPGDVTCVPSGSSVTFPAGRWNVFGRAKGLVSADPLLVDAREAPAFLTIPLLPAATLSVQLPP